MCFLSARVPARRIINISFIEWLPGRLHLSIHNTAREWYVTPGSLTREGCRHWQSQMVILEIRWPVMRRQYLGTMFCGYFIVTHFCETYQLILRQDVLAGFRWSSVLVASRSYDRTCFLFDVIKKSDADDYADWWMNV